MLYLLVHIYCQNVIKYKYENNGTNHNRQVAFCVYSFWVLHWPGVCCRNVGWLNNGKWYCWWQKFWSFMLSFNSLLYNLLFSFSVPCIWAYLHLFRSVQLESLCSLQRNWLIKYAIFPFKPVLLVHIQWSSLSGIFPGYTSRGERSSDVAEFGSPGESKSLPSFPSSLLPFLSPPLPLSSPSFPSPPYP